MLTVCDQWMTITCSKTSYPFQGVWQIYLPPHNVQSIGVDLLFKWDLMWNMKLMISWIIHRFEMDSPNHVPHFYLYETILCLRCSKFLLTGLPVNGWHFLTQCRTLVASNVAFCPPPHKARKAGFSFKDTSQSFFPYRLTQKNPGMVQETTIFFE